MPLSSRIASIQSESKPVKEGGKQLQEMDQPFMRKKFESHKCSDVKSWVIAAIREEERYPPDQMWEDDPAAEYAYEERLRRVKFLKKHVTPILMRCLSRDD